MRLRDPGRLVLTILHIEKEISISIVTMLHAEWGLSLGFLLSICPVVVDRPGGGTHFVWLGTVELEFSQRI